MSRATFKFVPGRRALTPRQIKDQYSIPPSSLHFYCTGLPEKERLSSMMLPGRKGKKTTRKVYEDELQKWLETHRTKAA